jgi:hypothetical protein
MSAEFRNDKVVTLAVISLILIAISLALNWSKTNFVVQDNSVYSVLS